jgi:hypothetical protein
MTSRTDWDISKPFGDEAEGLYSKMRSGVMLCETEVKHDGQSRTYNRIFIEYECKHFDGQWHPSGIAVTKAANWCHVTDYLCLVIPVWAVKRMCKLGLQSGRAIKKECVFSSHPTRGIAIPIEHIIKLYFDVLDLAEGKELAA